jgi:hypothetical protein
LTTPIVGMRATERILEATAHPFWDDLSCSARIRSISVGSAA